MLSCEICKIFENTYFEKHLRTTAFKIIQTLAIFILCTLTHFMQYFSFYTPWKHQKTLDFDVLAEGGGGGGGGGAVGGGYGNRPVAWNELISDSQELLRHIIRFFKREKRITFSWSSNPMTVHYFYKTDVCVSRWPYF